jgi:Flp pilus assembly protein TadG
MRTLLSRKGQSIVELVLMTPLVLVALYVPFDFGVTIFTGHITQNAVRDGARIASTTDLMDSAKAAALAEEIFQNYLPKNLLVSGSPAKKEVTVNYYDGGAANCAENVEVIARGTYNFFLYKLVGLLGITVPDGIEITRTTRMRYAHQPFTNGGTGSTTVSCTTTTKNATYPPET